MTNDDARELFAASGLTYKDVTLETLAVLHGMIDDELLKSGLMQGTFRCRDKVQFKTGKRFFAGIRCKSHYFEDREAVSFNDDGFIGFAGWADSKNIQPILTGFARWVQDMKDQRDRPERELFEAWASDPIRADRFPLERHDENGAYKDSRTYAAWYAWKHRAAILGHAVRTLRADERQQQEVEEFVKGMNAIPEVAL